MLCTTLSLLLAIRTTKKPFYRAGCLAFAAGLLAVLAGFGMRTIITGSVPVGNMYESVIFAAAGVALLGTHLRTRLPPEICPHCGRGHHNGCAAVGR